jgi:DNA-binding transcriptional ArsR family regulator
VLITRFGPDDLAATRFAISPLWDTVTSRWAVHDPARHAIHLPWIKTAVRMDRAAEFQPYRELLNAMIRPGSWLPDFITPPPQTPLTTVQAELAVLASTAPETVRADLEVTNWHTPLSALGWQVHAEPEQFLPLLVDALAAWWRLAVAPAWPRMVSLLEADIAYRTRILADYGPGQMFAKLHPSLRWNQGRLEMDWARHLELDLHGEGMPLAPSIFLDNLPAFTVRPESPVSMFYPARAIGTLWEQAPSPTAQPLVRLLGETRARMLAILDAPQTTSQLATRLELVPGGISAHLKVLHEAGLLTRHKQGKQVFYVCTELGRNLVGS